MILPDAVAHEQFAVVPLVEKPLEQPPVFSFARLPIAAISAIVSDLDCHSLRALLQADEQLRQHAVLFHVAHSRVKAPFFFTAKGLAQATIGYRQRDIIANTGHLIKLFEIKTQRWYSTSDGYLNCHLLAHDSRLCFVAVNRNVKLSDMGSKLKEPVFSQLKRTKVAFVGSKFDTAIDLTAPPSAENHSPSLLKLLCKTKASNPLCDPVYRTRGSVNHLVTLDITGAEVIEDLRLPYLKKLTIQFYKMEGFGVIKNIKALAVEHFSINYVGDMPIFEHIEIGSKMRLPTDERDKIGCFELCDTTAYNLGDDNVVNITTKLSNYKEMDLKFTKFFQYFVIVGPPDITLKFMDLSRASELYWMKTVAYPEAHDVDITELKYTPGNFYAPKLKELVIQTNVPDTTIPHFNLPSLEYLAIYTNAEGMSLNGLLGKIGNDVEKIRIVCDLPLDKVGGSGHITLTKPEIEYLLGVNSLRFIKVEGCYFGPSNGLFPLRCPPTTKTKDFITDMSIKCVRRNISGRNSRSLDLFGPPSSRDAATRFETLAVTQVAGGSSYTGFSRLKVYSLPFPVDKNAVAVRFIVSRDFENILVNGKSLHTVLMKQGKVEGRDAEWKLNYGSEYPVYAGSDTRDYYVDIF